MGVKVVAGDLDELPPGIRRVASTLAAFGARALFLWLDTSPGEVDGPPLAVAGPHAGDERVRYDTVVRACSCDGALSEHDHADLPDLLPRIIARVRPGFEGPPPKECEEPSDGAPAPARRGERAEGWELVSWWRGSGNGVVALGVEGGGRAQARRVAWLIDALATSADSDDLVVAGQDGAVGAIAPGAARALGVDPRAVAGQPLDALTPREVATRLSAIEPAETVRLRAVVASGEIIVTGRRDPRDGSLLVRVSPASEHDPRAERLDMLVAAIRHEIRTPLTVLRGVSTMLEEEPDMDVEDRQEFLRSLRRESQRVITLVEDLLTLDRLDAGRALSRQQPVDLAIWAETLLAEADAFCAAQRITIHREFTTDATPVEAERSLLDQLGRSLLGHVLRDTPRGLELTVRVRRDGELAVLEIDDSGPAPTGAAATEPFSTFKRSTATGKHAPGVGVGLHLAKKIADAHAWELRAERHPGHNRLVLRVPLTAPAA